MIMADEGVPFLPVESLAVSGGTHGGEALILLEQSVRGDGIIRTAYSVPKARRLLVDLKTVLDLYESMRPDEPL